MGWVFEFKDMGKGNKSLVWGAIVIKVSLELTKYQMLLLKLFCVLMHLILTRTLGVNVILINPNLLLKNLRG